MSNYSNVLISLLVWVIFFLLYVPILAIVFVLKVLFKFLAAPPDFEQVLSDYEKNNLPPNFERGVTAKGVKYIRKLGNKKDTIVFLHGANSSAMLFVDLMKSLPHTCYAFDIPGFGRSSSALLPNSIIDAIVELKIDRPILAGYSFGAYLAVKVSALMSVKGLVLIHPVGLLSTLGMFGAYWAVLFKSGVFQLPQFLNVRSPSEDLKYSWALRAVKST